MAASWIRGTDGKRAELLDALASALVALTLAGLVGSLWFHPRPFAIGLGRQYLAHVPDASFPSDHATLLFALAFSVLLSTGLSGAGVALTLIAVSVSWARIYLGVHFPGDILGAVVVAAISVGAIRPVRGGLRTMVYPMLLRTYDWLAGFVWR